MFFSAYISRVSYLAGALRQSHRQLIEMHVINEQLGMATGTWDRTQYQLTDLITTAFLLSTTDDTTGMQSIYTVYQGHELMFHVSTMLPYSKENKQQVGGYVSLSLSLSLSMLRNCYSKHLAT